MKQCTKCGERKPLDAFLRFISRGRQYVRPECRRCHYAQNAAHHKVRSASDAAYREHLKAASRARYATDAAYRERRKAARRIAYARRKAQAAASEQRG